MSFLDKSHAKAEAQALLGVGPHADQAQLRSALKRLAMEKHPDRGGTNEEFSAINAAYKLLRKDAPEAPAGAEEAPAFTGIRPRRMREPIQSRELELEESARAECLAHLARQNLERSSEVNETNLRGMIQGVMEANGMAEVKVTDHVASGMRATGRRISYRVDAPMDEGLNRVAVPTGELTDKRKVTPAVVRVRDQKPGLGIFTVPKALLSKDFPGAKRVRIHFANGDWLEPSAA